MNKLYEFHKCTTKTQNVNSVTIDCNMGLWSVTAPDELEAVANSLHYFRQYKEDGEYSSIIGGKTVAETLISKLN